MDEKNSRSISACPGSSGPRGSSAASSSRHLGDIANVPAAEILQRSARRRGGSWASAGTRDVGNNGATRDAVHLSPRHGTRREECRVNRDFTRLGAPWYPLKFAPLREPRGTNHDNDRSRSVEERLARPFFRDLSTGPANRPMADVFTKRQRRQFGGAR